MTNALIANENGAHFEWTAAGSTKYYSAGGVIAFRREGYAADTGLFWLLSDHLGSATRVLAADGTPRQQALYRAWGELRLGEITLTDLSFTGQRRAIAGLTFYQARWMDNLGGRFISPDTIVPLESQGVLAWERYQYTNSNPLRWNDPTGHCIDPSSCPPSQTQLDIKGFQIQVGVTIAVPVDSTSGSDKPPFPLLTYNLNFVFDDTGGFQIFGTTRDAHFVENEYNTTSYRPGPGELKEPSRLLNVSGYVSAGVIGGEGFNSTRDYEGISVDYQAGLGPVGADYYKGYNNQTGEFDSSYLWGFDAGYSVGAPISLGRVALISEPLTDRIQLFGR